MKIVGKIASMTVEGKDNTRVIFSAPKRGKVIGFLVDDPRFSVTLTVKNAEKLLTNNELKNVDTPLAAEYSLGDKVEILFDEEWIEAIVCKKVAVDPACLVEAMKLDKVEIIMSTGKLSVRPAEFDIPADPATNMDKWSIKSYKEHKEMSVDSICYSAKIYYQNKAVLEVSNRGDGGSDYIDPLKGEKSMLDKFSKDAQEWFTAITGQNESFEPESLFVDWFVNYRKVGIPACLYLKNDSQMVAAFSDY